MDAWIGVTCYSSRLAGVENWKLTPPQSLGEITASNEIGHVLKANIWLLVIKNLKTPQPYWEWILWKSLAPLVLIGLINKTFTLGEAKLVLGKRSHWSVLSPVVVFLISNHAIPPSSQCFVLAETSNASTHDQDVLFSLFNDKMPRLDVLLGAGVVSASEQNRIPVTVLHNSDDSVQLYAGTRVGELSSVKVQESTCHVNSVSHPPSPHPASPEREPPAVDLEGCDVTIAEKHKLKLLLEEYRDVFANSDDRLVALIELNFTYIQRTKSSRCKTPQYTICFTKRSLQIIDMENRGIIKPSSSPYYAPILLISKADGSYRFCADFQDLNDATLISTGVS